MAYGASRPCKHDKSPHAKISLSAPGSPFPKWRSLHPDLQSNYRDAQAINQRDCLRLNPLPGMRCNCKAFK